MKSTTIENIKNKCCAKANVPQIRIHDFRHSHASLLISLGVDISVVSKRLGHADASLTLKVYSHMFARSEEIAVDKISNL